MEATTMKDNVENQTISSSIDSSKTQSVNGKSSTKTANRPAMQIYRPPGLRSESVTSPTNQQVLPVTGSISAQSSGNSGQSAVNQIIQKDNKPPQLIGSLTKPQNLANSSSNPRKAAGSKPPEGNQHPQNYQNNSHQRGNNYQPSQNRANGRQQKNGNMTNEENNNSKKNAANNSESSGSRASSRTSSQNYDANPRSSGNPTQNQPANQLYEDSKRLNRTESSLSSESQQSQKSHNSTGAISGKSSNFSSSGGEVMQSFTVDRRAKQVTPKRDVGKQKKVVSEQQIEEATVALRALQINTCAAEIEMWISGTFSSEPLGEVVGTALCQHAIEGSGGRQVAKLCGLLKDSQSAGGLCRGLATSMSQYWDCRDKLRIDHFRMWIAYLNFVPDVYSNLGGGPAGELSSHVFQAFNYLLRAPVLESLKIEELECLISALLSVGYELERECPDQLALLKDLIRDAFIEVNEPWARKMILLLLELGASGWKLPAEANDYYFQQSNN